MSKRFYRVATGGALGAALLLSGCATGGEPSNPIQRNAEGNIDWSTVEPVELTVSSPFPSGVSVNKQVEEWMTAVTELSEGRITFNVYEAGALHPILESLPALSSGLTDVTYTVNSYFPDQLPVSNWNELVVQNAAADFGYPNTGIAGLGQAITNSVAAEEMLAETTANGFVPLMLNFAGPAALQCSEPFDSLADLDGRQVRVPNAVAQGEIEALGMTGVFMPTADMYEALQRGVLDCAVNSVALLDQILEVAPNVAIPNFAPTSAYWAVSTEALSQFSPEVERAIMDLTIEPYITYTKSTLDLYGQMPDAIEASGGELVDAKEMNEVLATWRADRPALAQSAPAAVKDPAAEVANAKENAQWWWNHTVNELDVPVTGDMTDLLRQGSDVVDWSAWMEVLRGRLADASS